MGTFVRVLAVGRIVAGVAMILKPEETVGGWIGGRTASLGGTQAVTQAMGARDLALGAGALAAFARGSDARTWVALGAFCDVVDLAATLTGEDIPLGGRVIVTAMATGAIAVSAGYLVSGASDA